MSYNPNLRGNNVNAASASTKAVKSTYQNGSGIALPQGTPVIVNSFGQLDQVDVANVAHIDQFGGVVGADLPNAATGDVYDAGRIQDVDLPAFSIGDALWVAKDGFLTNVKPQVGVGGFVSGDSVIFVGMIVKNEFNPALKDLKLLLDTKIGSL